MSNILFVYVNACQYGDVNIIHWVLHVPINLLQGMLLEHS